MKKTFILLILGVLALSGCVAGDIEAHAPWARPAFQGENSAVYLTLHNHSRQADELIGASSDVAEAVQIHLSQVDANGVMQMIHQESVALEAGGEAVFQPGGLHIMLIGLKRDLKVGEHFTVVLHFQKHADIRMDVTVQPLEGMEMNSSHEGTQIP
jgi:copper(I)-binding protein